MKIAVVGAGFVGQATGKGLSKHGHEITFVETDQTKVAQLRKEGFQAYTPAQYHSITTDVTMLCVPTPTEGKSINLNILKEAATDVAKRLKKHNKYHVVVVRSTVPPETTRKYVLPILRRIAIKEPGKDFGLAMQPEYLREATANEDFERPWYLLIGEYDKRSGEVVEKIYKNFDAPIEHCSLEEAEFQKYVHNLYNAVKIAFFNEMRLAAKRLNVDATKIFYATAESCEGIWNPIYGLRDYGPFDGSCLPKDTRALLQWGEANNLEFGILRAVIDQNLKHEQLLGKNNKVRVNYLAKINV